MAFSLAEIWHSMGIPAKVVGAVLLIMGLASLTAFIERIITLRRSRESSKKFAVELGDGLNAAAVEHVVEEASKYDKSHLAKLVESGLLTYMGARHAEEASALSPLERTRRHLERRLEELSADLRRGLPILASTGSVAPFVGLLGTVLGIISAFQGIASTGSGGLSSVAAGISEALIETALGLAVAIPAVLAFNYLSTQIARDEIALQSSAGELIDTIEGWGEGDGHGVRREHVA